MTQRIITVEYPIALTTEQREAIRKEIQRQIKGAKVIVLDNGGRLSPASVLR